LVFRASVATSTAAATAPGSLKVSVVFFWIGWVIRSGIIRSAAVAVTERISNSPAAATSRLATSIQHSMIDANCTPVDISEKVGLTRWTKTILGNRNHPALDEHYDVHLVSVSIISMVPENE
jgi:hypothetical protein